MAQPLPIVAQYAMDQFFQDYRPGTAFFNLQDFLFHCGATIGALYAQEFTMKYAELRQDKQEEIVTFSHDWLSEQVLKVQQKDHLLFAELVEGPMSFPYDGQDSGIQDVMPLTPGHCLLERTSVQASWQLQYLPATDRIFWWLDRKRIRFYNKGLCNITDIRVLYVPTISDNMLVPDGVVAPAIIGTVTRMKQIAEGVVQKKSLDQNDNVTMQTEIDQGLLKA